MVQEFGKLVGRTVARHLFLPKHTPHSSKNFGTPKMLVKAKTDNVLVWASIDTGTDRNFLSKELVDEWKIKTKKTTSTSPDNR
jgi:hypothetical protein